MLERAQEVVSVGSIREAMIVFCNRAPSLPFTKNESGDIKEALIFGAEHDFCREFDVHLVDGLTDSLLLTCLVPVPAGKRARKYARDCAIWVADSLSQLIK